MTKTKLKELKLKQISDSVVKGVPFPINKIGQRIKDLRESLGMTQQQLASYLQMQQSEISRIEENGASSSLTTISKIIQALGCSFMVNIASEIPLEDIIKHQANKRAAEILKRTYANMALEKQSPDQIAYTHQLETLTAELTSHPNASLWRK